jgi:hypothetical protein
VGLYASSTEGGEVKLREALRRLTPGEGLAQSVLEKGGERSASLGRKLLGLAKELLIEPNGSSHTSKHTRSTSICQQRLRGLGKWLILDPFPLFLENGGGAGAASRGPNEPRRGAGGVHPMPLRLAQGEALRLGGFLIPEKRRAALCARPTH